jgi:CRISPR-associated protein Cas2
MALVMVVTRDVPDRFHGFLASVMLEVSPNVFVSPRMSKGVRERTWKVLSGWHQYEPRGSVVIVWR